MITSRHSPKQSGTSSNGSGLPSARALPGADEVISYQIPAYKLAGSPVVYFAGWKQHYSIYPATAELVATFKVELAPYEISKGTIRFPLAQPVPVQLIRRLAKFRGRQVIERKKAKAAATGRS
jgi:uncharacterized protein YdhG (YjbR/CyaY superfamily)